MLRIAIMNASCICRQDRKTRLHKASGRRIAISLRDGFKAFEWYILHQVTSKNKVPRRTHRRRTHYLFQNTFLFQASSVNLNNPDDCGRKFRSNRNLGLILLGAIIMGNLWRKEKTGRKKHEAHG